MFIGKQKTPTSVLEKKVPKNPKYKGIRGNLDTGTTVNKVKCISTKEFLKRQNELFARIKAKQLADILEIEPLVIDERIEDQESGTGEEAGKRQENDEDPDREGVHERDGQQIYFDKKTIEAKQQQKQDEKKNVMILDIRNAKEFEICHIKTASSFPAININQDRFTASMYRFKNKPGKTIVIYDCDEGPEALAAATRLVERGFDNIRLLTGGLKSFGNSLPHLLEGVFPSELVQKAPISPTESTATRREERRRRRKSAGLDYSPRDSSSYSSSSYSSSYAGSVSGSSVASTVSLRSTFSRAPRWKDDRRMVQRHKEIVAKMHHTQ